MKPIYVRLGFGVLLGWQVMTALVNMAVGHWNWVVFDLACMAVVAMSWAITERSLRSITSIHRRNRETVAHYKSMLDAMRRDGDDEGERYALTMLSIWGWKGD